MLQSEQTPVSRWGVYELLLDIWLELFDVDDEFEPLEPEESELIDGLDESNELELLLEGELLEGCELPDDEELDESVDELLNG